MVTSLKGPGFEPRASVYPWRFCHLLYSSLLIRYLGNGIFHYSLVFDFCSFLHALNLSKVGFSCFILLPGRATRRDWMPISFKKALRALVLYSFTPLSEHCGITKLESSLTDTRGESNSAYPVVLNVTDTWILLMLEKNQFLRSSSLLSGDKKNPMCLLH